MQNKLLNFHFKNQKIRQMTILFSLFTVLLEVNFFNLGFQDYFANLLTQTGVVQAIECAFYISAAIFLFVGFVFVALSSARKYKVLYFILFSTAIFFEYGYQKAFGRFSDIADFEAIFATNSEHKLSGLSYISFFALVPCIVFGLCLYAAEKPKIPLKLKSFVSVLLFQTLFFFQYGFVAENLGNRFPNISFNAFYQTSVETFLFGSRLTAPKTRLPVKKPNLPKNYRPDNNIVLIVDESIRGDHLSLNGYERETTPFLKELSARGILHNWGIAAAATTASHTTQAVLISGLTSDDLPFQSKIFFRTFEPDALNLYNSPTFFQYAKAMNYRTIWFDGQMEDFWGIVADDKNYIDEWNGVDQLAENRNLSGWEMDEIIAGEINRIITSSTGNFIYVNKRGFHIPYQNKYPSEAKYWKPALNESDNFGNPMDADREKLVNSYDNAIRFNLDSFFKVLVPDYEQPANNSLIIYTGDHGQNFSPEAKASHGGKSREEASVPLFIVGNLGKVVDTDFKAAHANILPTLLDLMNFPAELRARNYAVSLLEAGAADSRPRFFNPNWGNKVPFD